MSNPVMKCHGEYPEFEIEENIGGVRVTQKPEICKECEFYQFCVLQQTSHILGLPMKFSEQSMLQLVYLQRLQDSGADDQLIGAFMESMCSTSKQ